MMSAREPATLAMMPLIAPAVIKLDVTVTQGGLGWQLVNTLDIVYEEAERTGATILAEGIENRTHLNVARSLGAVLGQGHYLGVPAAPTDQMRRPARRIEIGAQTPPAVSTPIGALSDHLIGRSGTDLLGLLCRRIESSVEHAPVPALLISLLPEPGMFGEEERTRFARLADRGATTAILGPGIRAEPGSNIRGTGLRHEEPIEGEWAMVALNPAATGAMLARVARDGVGYEFGVTHETPRVLAAARCLFRRLGAPIPQWTPERTIESRFLASATVGTLFSLARRRGARRRRRRQAPPPWRIRSLSCTVPHHPEDGYFLGAIFLGLAVWRSAGWSRAHVNLC